MEDLKKAIELLKEAKHIVVITGAGMSTNAGIPDYRSNEGIYKTKNKDMFTLDYFANNKKEFYEEMNSLLIGRRPTKAHYLLANLLNKDKVKEIYTQNIDNLHLYACSIYMNDMEDSIRFRNKIHNVHGKYLFSVCEDCGERRIVGIKGHLKINKCKDCNSENIRPDIVFFGEMPRIDFDTQMRMLNADCLLILGTSGMVNTVQDLIEMAPCANRIYINKEESEYLDKIADVSIRMDLDEAMEIIENNLLNNE